VKSEQRSRKLTSWLLLLCAVMAGGLAAGVAPVAAKGVRVFGPKVISRGTPLPKRCERLRQETDTMLAADPADARHLLATWDVDAHHSNVTAVSRDSGKTWKLAPVPGISKCTGGASDEVVDPFVAIGAGGRALFTSLPLSVSGFLTNRSPDGGSTWSAPSVADPSAGLTDDLPSLVADPDEPLRAFLTWSHFDYTGNVQTGGDARLAQSTDGGVTWGAPSEIRSSPAGKAIVESRLQLLPDHTLLDVFGEPPAQPPTAVEQMYATRSSDSGQTWSSPVRIGQVAQDPIRDPDSGKPIYTFCCLFSVAARGQNAYLAFTKVAGVHSGKVFVAHSANGGQSWAKPRAVTSIKAQTLIPTVAVADDGTVGLTWYDFHRDKRHDKPLTTDYWFAYSGDHAKHWHRSHLGGPFDLRSSPRKDRPVGVYEGLTGLEHGFASTFIQATPQAKLGPDDVFFARLALPRP
jgi:hypothetical protein